MTNSLELAWSGAAEAQLRFSLLPPPSAVENCASIKVGRTNIPCDTTPHIAITDPRVIRTSAAQNGELYLRRAALDRFAQSLLHREARSPNWSLIVRALTRIRAIDPGLASICVPDLAALESVLAGKSTFAESSWDSMRSRARSHDGREMVIVVGRHVAFLNDPGAVWEAIRFSADRFVLTFQSLGGPWMFPYTMGGSFLSASDDLGGVYASYLVRAYTTGCAEVSEWHFVPQLHREARVLNVEVSRPGDLGCIDSSRSNEMERLNNWLFC